MGGQRYTFSLLALVLFALLSLMLTAPLAGYITTHVPGDGGDDPALAWNLWWVKYSLVDLGRNPFDCRHMFYPLGINLAFYTLTVLNGCLSLPLQAVFNLVTVSNLVLLSSFVLGAFGAYLLTLDLLRSSSRPAARAGAVFAGLIYGFSSSKLFYASLGQFNIASNQWVPFYVLMLLRAGRYPRRTQYAILAGLFLLFQGWAEMTYASFLLVFTGIYVAACLPRFVRESSDRWSWLRALSLIAAIFLAGMSPILAQMLPDMRSEGDFFVEGSGFAETFSCDLAGFFIPTQLHPWAGVWAEALPFPHEKGQHYFLGYSVLALAWIGATFRRRQWGARLWMAAAFIFLLLTLGPSLHFWGRDLGIPLPFRLFQALPFFKGNRYPSRYGVMLLLSLAPLAGAGLAWIGDRLASRQVARWGVTLACVAFFLVEHLSVPLPLSDLRVPPAYALLEAGDYAVLDLPIAWRNGFRITGIMDPVFMYAQFYQTAHHKRLLGGNTSRNPEIKFQYFTESPVFNSLIALENGRQIDAARREQDRAVAPALFHFLDIRYVVLHKRTGASLQDYIESVLPVVLIYEDADYRVYRARLAADSANATLGERLGEPFSRLVVGEGWGQPADGAVWAQSWRARLLLPVEEGQLTFQLRAPGPQRVSIRVNDCHVGQVNVDADWGTFTFLVSSACAAPAVDDIWLQSELAFVPGQARSPESTRRLPMGVVSPVEITVRSAGKLVGDFGRIFVDGVDHSPGRRGYNLVVIDPTSGAILSKAQFDTHLDSAASGRLAEFIGRLPAGVVVAVAAMDEASLNLSTEAVQALHTLGIAGDLRGRFRWSHAAVGVKGAPAGSALEFLDENWPATVTVGNGLTGPAVYVQLGSVRFTPAAAAR